LHRYLKTPGSSFAFVFRLWDDDSLDHLEFRGFVYHHELTALTQYDERCFVPDIAQNKDEILAAIQSLFQEVRDRFMADDSPFKLGNYVMDFGIKFQGGTTRAHIIEINRFNTRTGASLFDWNRDLDVMVGRKPFEFRIVTEHMYDNVDYACVIYPDWAYAVKDAKAGIVEKHKRRSFCEVA
jgi:hypothetical protein